jgi:NAD(P)-dependent dehydrogenase (short-subunit alcohol dehydrogenase family)
MARIGYILVALIAVWLAFFQKGFKTGGAVSEEWLQRSLSGKLAVITGANTGIGIETAKQLAKQGANVIVASRDAKKAQEAVALVNKYVNAERAEFVAPLDLASLESVRNFAEKLKDRKIDYLINNAGVMVPEHDTTKDGFEIQFGTNHLSHFLVCIYPFKH